MKHTSKRCCASIRRNENMPDICSSAFRYPFVHFALRSSQRFLQSISTRKQPLPSTRICGPRMQKRRCCPHAPVSLRSSIEKAARSYNSHTSLSESSWNRSDSRRLTNVFRTITFSPNMHIPSLHMPVSVSFSISTTKSTEIQ